MKHFTALTLLILITQVACQAAAPELAESGFKFFDPDVQMLLVEGLKKEGISYKIRDDGTVLYSPSDESKVSRIRTTVLKQSFKPSVHYEDKTIESRFLERLKSEGILYGIEIKQGKRWITWSEKDDQRIENIRATLW